MQVVGKFEGANDNDDGSDSGGEADGIDGAAV